jgi:hypothetical protein
VRRLIALSLRFPMLFFVMRRFRMLGFLVTARLFPTGFLASRLVAPFLFAARHLNAAKGAAKIFNLALVIELLVFSEFDQLKNVLHFLKCLFKGSNDATHLFRSLGHRRSVFLRRRRRRGSAKLGTLNRALNIGRLFRRRRL